MVKSLQMLPLYKVFPIIRVNRLPSKDEQKHFVVRLCEAPNRQGRYFLPLHHFFCEDEIIQIIISTLYVELVFRVSILLGAPLYNLIKFHLTPEHYHKQTFLNYCTLINIRHEEIIIVFYILLIISYVVHVSFTLSAIVLVTDVTWLGRATAPPARVAV